MFFLPGTETSQGGYLISTHGLGQQGRHTQTCNAVVWHTGIPHHKQLGLNFLLREITIMSKRGHLITMSTLVGIEHGSF